MRFRLELALEKPELPIEYRKAILSLIKTSLTQANDGQYFELFFYGTKSKDYTFTVKLPKAVFQKNVIELDRKSFSVTFSTYDKTTGYILFAALSEQLKKRFPLSNDNSYNITGIRLLKEQEVNGNQVLFKMCAPLVIRKHNRENNKDYYYVFHDEEFVQESLIVIKNQLLNAGYREEQITDLKITPINMKKVVVKHYGCSIPCSLGYVMMEGNKSVLNYLYKSGIGSRRSEGFAFVDMAIEEV